jgi:hypothetical protein
MSVSNDKLPRSRDITALRSALAPLGIFVYEYEAMPELRGGCWSLVVRKSDTMVRFFWDGRDDLLTVEEAAYIPSSREFLWRPTSVPRVEVDETREPFRYVEEVLKGKFCA